MGHPLLPDLSVTIEIDPIEAKMQQQSSGMAAKLDAIAEVLKDPRQDSKVAPGLEKERVELEAAKGRLDVVLAEYLADPEPKLKFIVGYIKPAKLTELRFRLMRERGTDEDPNWLDVAERMDEVNRDVVKWGVKGCTAPEAKWEPEKAVVRGRQVDIAPEYIVEAIEARGWLETLTVEILNYNTLDADSKKK